MQIRTNILQPCLMISETNLRCYPFLDSELMHKHCLCNFGPLAWRPGSISTRKHIPMLQNRLSNKLGPNRTLEYTNWYQRVNANHIWSKVLCNIANSIRLRAFLWTKASACASSKDGNSTAIVAFTSFSQQRMRPKHLSMMARGNGPSKPSDFTLPPTLYTSGRESVCSIALV